MAGEAMSNANYSNFDSTMLPEQHEDQLQLGFRIIQNCFKNKVQALEQENKGLRLGSEEQKNQIVALQRKNSALEHELVESHHRTQQLADENKELFKTVQQLRKRLGVLEDLKKKVQQHHAECDAVNAQEGDHYKVSMSEDHLRGSVPMTMASLHSDVMSYGQAPQQPLAMGAGASPMYPQAPVQSYQPPGPMTPPPPVAERSMMAAAPQPASQPMVDGKQFFRNARSQLSYEAFNEFLANIKRLNNQQQTREETLDEARRIFGPGLAPLYKDFEQLLNRNTI